MASISTVGNATLIAYEDSKPILSTDPWFGGEDHAYFGSWNLSHEIPHSYKQDILNSVFFPRWQINYYYFKFIFI